MTRRNRRVALFRYSAERHASRTLRVLREAWPETDFRLVPESLGWGWNILATTSQGSGRVARAPLALIRHNGAVARQNKES
jgi:hypothetical protein